MAKGRGDYFNWEADQIVMSQCVYCKHKTRNGCAAFPEGIPNGILENVIDHRVKQPGDNGIQFEQRESGPKAPWEKIFP